MEANKRLNVACLQKAQQDNDIHVSTAREHRLNNVIVPKKKDVGADCQACCIQSQTVIME